MEHAAEPTADPTPGAREYHRPPRQPVLPRVLSSCPPVPAPAPDSPPPRPVPDDKKATEHLANERTFLAWVRTSIAVVSLGFVVAKFGLWLERLALLAPGQPHPSAHPQSLGWSLPIGAGMMIVGALLPLLAAWHFHRTTRQIEAGHVVPSVRLVGGVSLVVAALAAIMVVYLLLSAR